jgi:hypothetical protein
MTNKGVQMKVPFIRIDESQRAMLLKCHFQGQDYPVIVLITPARLGNPFSSDMESSKFSRCGEGGASQPISHLDFDARDHSLTAVWLSTAPLFAFTL